MKKKLICFDAVGTLIETKEPVGVTYYRFGTKHGSKKSLEDIIAGLKTYYPLYFAAEAMNEFGSSETIEKKKWRSLISDIFSDLENTEHLFDELWMYYSSPSNWFVIQNTYEWLKKLHSAEIDIALASNFDRRLIIIAQQLLPVITRENIFTSSRLGFAKPDVRFYAEIERFYSRESYAHIMIGDDQRNDYDAAIEAGWNACPLDSLNSLEQYL